MNNTSFHNTRSAVIASACVAFAICVLPAGPAMAAGSPPVETAAVVTQAEHDAAVALAATPWQTTGAVDQDGAQVALDDPRAANFVGNAYFKTDGTFTMFNLDDSPKMQGDWEMREVDGQLVRWIAAKNAAGEVMFERTVPIVALDGAVFTYRVVSAEDPASWVDVVHTPTDHAEPESIDDTDIDTGNTGGSEDGGIDGVEDSSQGVGDRAAVTEASVESQRLAETGGAGVSTGILAAITALVSGVALLLSRVLRRARS